MKKLVYFKFEIIILVIGLCFSSCKKEKLLIEEIYDDPGYSIGFVDYSTSIPLKVTYHYDYEVDGIAYKGTKISRGIGQSDSYSIGRNFLVVYKLSDPKDSDLNFDYLIESEQDFEDFLIEFESLPPKP